MQRLWQRPCNRFACGVQVEEVKSRQRDLQRQRRDQQSQSARDQAASREAVRQAEAKARDAYAVRRLCMLPHQMQFWRSGKQRGPASGRSRLDCADLKALSGRAELMQADMQIERLYAECGARGESSTKSAGGCKA